MGIWPPAHRDLGEIDGLLVPTGKSTDRPSDYWLTAHVCGCPGTVISSNHPYILALLV